MRFINTKRASPVALKKDLPDSRDYFHLEASSIDEVIENGDYVTDDDWWEKQYNRCTHGVYLANGIEPGGDLLVDGIDCIWSEDGRDCYIPDLDFTLYDRKLFIPPRMYFYLNFWWIKGTIEGSDIKGVRQPRYTDLSWFNWMIKHQARKLGKDMVWFKARQKGLSEEAACDVGYEYLMLNNSQSIIVASLDQYAENTMNMVLRGLERLKNTQFYKEPKRGHDRNDYKKSKHTGSEIWKMTAKDNIQVLSGKTPSLVYCEEVGIWKKGTPTKIYQFIDPSIRNLGKKTGWINYIGTGGEADDAISDMQEMFHNPDSFNLMKFRNKYDLTSDVKIGYFVSTLAFKVIDEDGNSLFAEAEKIEDEERASKNAKERYLHVMLNPKNPEELFQLKSGGYFGPDVAQHCQERKMKILNYREKQIAHRYKLEWVNPAKFTDGVRAIPWEEGKPLDDYPVFISEPPTLDADGKPVKGLYKLGTDSYDQDEAKTSSSKGACVVLKTFRNANESYNKFVAYVLERPTVNQGGRDVFYENTAKLTMLYNGTNLVEHSKLLIFPWYEQHGLGHLLALKPSYVVTNMVENTQTTNRYGIDASLLPYGLKMLKDFLTFDNINQIDFIEMLDAFSMFKIQKDYNCDLTIACVWAVVQKEEDVLSYERKQAVGERQNKIRTVAYKRINGKIVIA